MRHLKLLTTVYLAMTLLTACQAQPPTTPSSVAPAVANGANVTSAAGHGSLPVSSVFDDDSSLRAVLTANRTTIRAGEPVTLSWTTDDAEWVKLDNTYVTRQGSQTVTPSATTTYTLTAGDERSTVTDRVTITVSDGHERDDDDAPPTTPPPPSVSKPTANIVANPSSIMSGQSSTLTWATTNATSVTLDGLAVSSNGSRMVSPSATTTYTLTAVNAAGTTTSTAVVMVAAPPPPPPPPPAFTYTGHIKPVIDAQCIGCHHTGFASGGVDLSSYQSIQPLVASHDTNALLVRATQPGGKMNSYVQPFGTMSAAQVIDMIKQWVLSGAPQ